MAIKALVFDAYGTLYDAHSVYTKTEELCPSKGDLISEIWRLKQLEYTWLQTSLLEYRDIGFLTRGVARIWLRAAGGAHHRAAVRQVSRSCPLSRTPRMPSAS